MPRAGAFCGPICADVSLVSNGARCHILALPAWRNKPGCSMPLCFGGLSANQRRLNKALSSCTVAKRPSDLEITHGLDWSWSGGPKPRVVVFIAMAYPLLMPLDRQFSSKRKLRLRAPLWGGRVPSRGGLFHDESAPVGPFFAFRYFPTTLLGPHERQQIAARTNSRVAIHMRARKKQAFANPGL